MVEFALVLVPLLLIIFGFLEFGVAINAKIDATHLTAEGARYIAVGQNPGLTDPLINPKRMPYYIRSRADTDFLKQAKVCIDYPNNPATSTSGQVGDPVRVTLTHVYPIVPFVGQKLAPVLTSLSVTSETTMRLEAKGVPAKIPVECTS